MCATHLSLGTSLGHELVTDLDTGFQQVLHKFLGADTAQESDLVDDYRG